MSMINIAGAQHVRWATKQTDHGYHVTVEVWGSKKDDGRYGSYTSISLSAKNASATVQKGGEVGVEGERFLGDYVFGSTVTHLEAIVDTVEVSVEDGTARFALINNEGRKDGWLTISASDSDGAPFKEIK